MASSSQSCSNLFSSIIDLLFLSINNGNNLESSYWCDSLSSVINHAILNHEVPSRRSELPFLMNQLYKNKDDSCLLAHAMALMLSVKTALKHGWFTDEGYQSLSNLARQMTTIFGNAPNVITEPNSSLPLISEILSRYCPQMKVGEILVSVEVKPGFDAYLGDFEISELSPTDTVRLFVVQTDSIQTPSCLISPPKVDFLLNGLGVEKRIQDSMDTWPQLPTNVSNMVRLGSNLLQAVGEFHGNYIIVLAFMSMLPSPDSNTLQAYEQCGPTNVDSDSDDVIEVSSRISLKCPISSNRIKIPVKGHSCNHFQCFDYNSYVDMNSTRPSWCCPHCYQHVCFPDIRIDRKMVKVLQEVGPNVSYVMFSSDGNVVPESEDAKRNSEDNTGQNNSGQATYVFNLDHIGDTLKEVSTNISDEKLLDKGIRDFRKVYQRKKWRKKRIFV